ncbi:MAG TPA: ankyrin repeat domain-containing protein [Blastocatellia bacterium]|nr:ankyrin repeat domain-containing protein [Blastocatellia bacterium]
MKSRRIIAALLVLLFPVLAQAQDLKEGFLNAVRKGDVEAVKSYLAKGVDVNAKLNNYGGTALAFACDRGHTEVVKLLIEKGADVNARDTFYQATPITWAAQRGHTEIVKTLLDKGATGSKDQLLMMGLYGHHTEMMKMLLERGGILPETLTSALAQAEKNEWADVVDLLKRAGAKPTPKPEAKVDKSDDATLKNYEGVYKNDQIGDLTFAIKDGKFMGMLTGQDWFTTKAIDKDTFTVVEVDGVNIKFNSEGGKVTGLTLKQGGYTFEFKRVEQK